MSTKFICDGCGKEVVSVNGLKPYLWFDKTIRDKSKEYNSRINDRVIHACERRCIEKASQKFEVDSLVLPI